MPDENLLLKMEQIDKQFPGVHALDHVDFDLREGEVHILLGENGAGKSTLVKILSGSLPRDSGRITIRGQEVDVLTPERSNEMGIGMVYQELSLVPTLTVAENIFLGRPLKNRFGAVDWAGMKEKAGESLAELGVDIDLDANIRQLNVAEQQLTEIARILVKEPKIILLDEPTSALSESERDRLFQLIHRLLERKVGIVYISHRLEEVPLIGNRVTVLRDGRVVGTLPVSEVTEDKLIEMMVGRQLAEQFTKHAAVQRAGNFPRGAPVCAGKADRPELQPAPGRDPGGIRLLGRRSEYAHPGALWASVESHREILHGWERNQHSESDRGDPARAWITDPRPP